MNCSGDFSSFPSGFMVFFRFLSLHCSLPSSPDSTPSCLELGKLLLLLRNLLVYGRRHRRFPVALELPNHVLPNRKQQAQRDCIVFFPSHKILFLPLGCCRVLPVDNCSQTLHVSCWWTCVYGSLWPSSQAITGWLGKIFQNT